MKKYASILVVLILLSFCLSFSVYAETPAFSISEDFQTLYRNGNSYSRVNVSTIATYLPELPNAELQLSSAQQEVIKDVSFYANGDCTIVSMYIDFKDGSMLSASFLQDSCRDTYEHLLNDPSVECTIDFCWPTGNTITVKASELSGKVVELTGTVLTQGDTLDVLATSPDEHFEVYRGVLILHKNQYYYVDFQENEVLEPEYFSLSSYSSLKAYQITDSTLWNTFNEAETAYRTNSFGFLYDESFMGAIALAFLTLLFAVTPLAVAVTALIFATRSKGYYRLIWGTTTAVSAIGLAAFAILCILLVIFL